MEYQDNNKILKDKYDSLTDGELINLILAEPHDENAALYLLYIRYNSQFRKVYYYIDKTYEFFEDCLHDLFMYLRGSDGSWKKVSTFDGDGTFGGWLWKVAKREFPKSLRKLIDNGSVLVSIDTDDPIKPIIQDTDDPEENYDRRLLRVLLLEAIGKLKQEERRFICLKRLEGYSSKEITDMLKIVWERDGVVKYNKGEVVVPTEAYVNSCSQKARRDLRKILNDLREEIL